MLYIYRGNPLFCLDKFKFQEKEKTYSYTKFVKEFFEEKKKKLESVHRAQTTSQYIFQVQKLKENTNFVLELDSI